MKFPSDTAPWSTVQQFDAADAGYYLGVSGFNTRIYQKLSTAPDNYFEDDACDWFELSFGTGTTSGSMADMGVVLIQRLTDPAPLVDALQDCLLAIQTYRKKVILGDLPKTESFRVFTDLANLLLDKIKQ